MLSERGLRRADRMMEGGRPWSHQGTRLLLLVSLALAACASPVGAPNASNNSAPAALKQVAAIMMGVPTAISTTLNPPSGAGAPPGLDTLEELLHVGLVTNGKDDLLEPRLAETVPTLENGQWKLLPGGGMETIWRIREGAAWHDGSPFTTDDLLFTLRVGRDRELPIFGHASFALIDQVDASDSQTLTVRWSRPFINADRLFMRSFALPLPRHLLERAYEDSPASLGDLPYWTNQFVGTGPFRLREFVVDSHIILDANPRYLLGRPRIDVVDIRFVPDANALIAHMLAGSAHLTMGARISLDQALQLQDQWREGTVLFTPTSWVNIYPQLINPSPAIILEPRFRRALAHAVDRQAIQDTLFHGTTAVVEGVFGPYQPGYAEVQDAIVRYPYDQRRTIQIFEELGYRRAADSSWRDAEAEKLTVELRSTAQLDHDAKAVAATADDWLRTGLGVEQLLVPIQRVPDREYRHTRPGFEIVSGGAGPEALENLRSTRAPLPANSYTGTNRSRFQSAEYDALLDRYLATVPRVERLQVLRDMVRLVSDQVVFIGLSYTPTHLMVANKLSNVTGRGFLSVTGWNATEWELR